jgi:CRISPR-associated Csx2 family protein
MWDELLNLPGCEPPDDDPLLEQLMEAVDQQNVDQPMLQQLQQRLQPALDQQLSLGLIPYCEDQAEQIQLLTCMADQVNPRDQVDLDVTHGFRHLPMIALMSAMYLESVRDARINAIWYGSYDPDAKKGKIHDLAGLLEINHWLQALNSYDKDGDYSPVAKLLEQGGEQLTRAAFQERTTNSVKARESLRGWRSQQQQIPASNPIETLFLPQLEQRLKWVDISSRAGREAKLARLYLARSDYLRATLYGMESVISAKVEEAGGNTGDYHQREEERKAYRKASDDFSTLTFIRNALAHGVVVDSAVGDRIRRLVSDQQRLEQEIQRLFASLLPR